MLDVEVTATVLDGDNAGADMNSIVFLSTGSDYTLEVHTDEDSVSQNINISVKWKTDTFEVNNQVGTITIINCASDIGAGISIYDTVGTEHWTRD